MNLDLLESFIPSKNVMPYRNYYIPFSFPSDSLKKETSQNVHLLSDWTFKFYPFYSPNVDSDIPNQKIQVPHNWQKLGYDIDNYVNVFYPFPYDPPFIQMDNPCGVYVTNYEIKNKQGKYYLIFDGVDSAYYLNINGKDVGFATGSHCYHEFDITNFVNQGQNNIRVTVFEMCTGSYIECQDKFRLSGIFRDVYILNIPNDHIFNYSITSSYSDTNGKIVVNCDKSANVTLYFDNKKLDSQIGENCVFDITDVKLWNCETPNLYKILIEYNGEFITDYHGIRSITIKDRIFKLNNTPIKLKGVNRHSSNQKGYVETLEDIELDLKIMREHNINTIRTSHYQPHPYLPLLCDKYGIYLVLECDIETHGDQVTNINIPTPDFENWQRWNRISSSNDFLPLYLDRAKNMYSRDKNRSSIIMWSLGNEAGWGSNLIAMSNFLRSVDSRPIHYEGACRANNINNLSFNVEGTSVFSRMYPSISDCIKILENKELLQPFFLCEYTHAMGNSCGDISEYWNIIYNDDRFMGGCIWEWCDHTIITDDGKFLYGGDSGAKLHSGNFCVDGLVDTDRKFIHSALKETKEVYAPVDVVYNENQFLIFNRYDFIDLDNILCKVFIENDGKILNQQTVNLNGIKPHSFKKFDINFKSFVNNFTTINFYFYKNNFEIAKRQIVINEDYILPTTTNTSKNVSITGDKYSGFVVNTGTTTYKMDRTGMIYSIFTDKEWLNSKIQISTNRAFLDNDKQLKPRTFDDFKRSDIVKTSKFYARNLLVKDNQIIITGYFGAQAVEAGIEISLTYTFFDNGKVSFDLKGKQHSSYLDLITRFGFEIDLINNFERCNYFGKGKYECYIDKKFLSTISDYDEKITDMFVSYVKPQDSGNHTHTRKVRLYGNKELLVLSNNYLNFSLAPCKAIDYPSHRHLLPKNNSLVLNINSNVRGVGSHSCGPDILDKYKILDKNLNLKFDLIIK